jgi:acyl-CoA synthetase (AMP-forming)/AMP-acid ligase II
VTGGDPFALAHDGIAVVEASGRAFTYGEMREACGAFAARCRGPAKGLGLVLCERSARSVVAYVGGVIAGDAVALLEAKTDRALLESFVATYAPDWIAAASGVAPFEGYARTNGDDDAALWRREAPSGATVHPDLTLLLSTSGTTGSRKLVRLSRRNVVANAQAIAQYLGLHPGERPLLVLPISYSFGLSVVHSHLASGGAVLVSEHAVTSRDLWTFAARFEATSLSGVPTTYQMLSRLDVDKLAPPSLTTLCQAGGRLDPSLGRRYAEWAIRQPTRRFFVMYGQTEATARMSYVPPERALEKHATIGVPIPGGALRLDAATSEIVYEGPNVMMGYATSRQELARGDDLGGVLATGDVGEIDSDGFFRVVGRRSRFVKIFGLRVGLDEVEVALAGWAGAELAVVGEDDRLTVAVTADGVGERARELIRDRFGIHPSVVAIRKVDAIPRTAKGTVDYRRLAEGGT